jgi:hypothetical protein
VNDADRVLLLHGPYAPPPLRKGDRACCLLRDCTVVITSWTAARIPWPRCQALDGPGGGSGILLDEELARTVRCGSAAAVCFWWRVSKGVVWRWRKALGVRRMENDGSRRLVLAAASAGGQAMRKHEYTDEECDERSRRARGLNLGRNLVKGYQGPRWTKRQLRLLGKYPDDEVARRTGRSRDAVRSKREALGIPNPGGTRWSAAEDALVRTFLPPVAAARTGRSLKAVYERRRVLGLPDGRANNSPRWRAGRAAP